MTMPDHISNFLTDLEKEGLSPNTVKAYGQDLRAWANDMTALVRKALATWLTAPLPGR